MAVPNEYPGQIYAFNWSLNADGVTPLKKSAFRITKPLDLKVAGLEQPKTNPLKVNANESFHNVRRMRVSHVFTLPSCMQVKAAAPSKMPEAGSDQLSFDTFDEVAQRTKDLLSLSDHLYCPEGHVPGTRTGVRVITNSGSLAPQLLAYLDRAPRKDPPENQPITAYILEGTEEEFAGYAIEEVEFPVDEDMTKMDAKSVAAVVVVGNKPDIKVIVAGLESCQAGLAADEAERAEKAAEESKDE